ncbi:MAG: hypothetical protein ACLVJO_04195 [[Clostridium] scindens]
MGSGSALLGENLRAVAADYPDVKIHEVPAEHNPAKCRRRSRDSDSKPDEGSIAGIFGTYDQVVSGASEAIRRAGRGQEIKMVVLTGTCWDSRCCSGRQPIISTVVMDTESIGKQSGTSAWRDGWKCRSKRFLQRFLPAFM